MPDVLATLQKLPEICAARLASTGEPIMIRRGVRGYYPAPPRLDVDAWNAEHNVSKAQVLAMEVGSCFGWEVPGADPDQYPELAAAEAVA
jgi:hypothetical protein